MHTKGDFAQFTELMRKVVGKPTSASPGPAVS